MAQSKQFEFILNFATQFDKSKVAEIVSQLQSISKSSKFELGFDKQALVKEFENLSKVIDQISKNAKGIDVNIDINKALKDFDKFSIEMEKVLNSDLGKAFDDIDLSSLDKSINEIDKAFENIDLDELEKAMKEVKAPETAFDGLKDGAEKADLSVAQIRGKMGALAKAGKQNTDEYREWQRQLGLAQKEAQAYGGAMEKVSNEAKKAGSFTERMANFGLATQGIQAVAGGIQDLAQPFIALDTATQNLKTLGTEAAAMAPNLREAAITMSKDLPFAAAELQTTMFDALASGVKGGEEGLKAFAETSAKLAVGGGADIGASTSLLAGQLNAYGKTAEDAAKFSDIFFNTVNYGVTSIPELSSTLANVIPTAASLGIELENVGASLAQMTSKGIPTAQATTKLNALLIELAKPGAALAPILTKAGVSLDSLKKDDLPVTLGKINEALKATGKASIEVFSSSEAGAAFASLAGDVEGFSQTFRDVRDTTGSANNAYNQMADSIEVRTKQIQTKVEALVIQGMGSLGNSFTVVANSSAKLAPMVTTMVGLGQALPIDKMKTFGTSALGVAKNFGSLGGISTNIASAKGAITGLGPTLAKLGPMLANPYVLAGAGLALFLTQTEAGKKTLAKFGDLGTEIMNKFKPIGDWLTKVLFGALDFVGELLVNVGELLTSQFTAMFDVFMAVGEAVGDMYKAFFDLTGITAIFNSLFGSLSGGGDAFATLEGAVGTFFDYLSKVPLAIALIYDSISGLAKNAPELISALGELIKIELNPANWFGEDGEAEKKAKEKLANVMDKALSGAKQRIGNFQLGEALDKAMESKKKLDKSAELEKLTKDFANASNEIQKGDIATKIAELAPDAVKGYRSIVNAQGEVVQVADLNIEKLKELAKTQKESANIDLTKATKEYATSLKNQADEYDKMKTKSEQLKNKIVSDGKAGIDTTKSVKEFEDLSKELAGKSKNISKTLAEATKANITVSGIDLPDSVETDFADQVSKVVTSPSLKKASDELNNIIKLKGDLDGDGSLNKLMDKYNKATTDAERENIAKVIQKNAPDAVKAIGTITDEQGNVITQYGISSEKVKEYADTVKKETESKILEAQKIVKDGMIEEAGNYDTLKVKLIAKQKEINDAKNAGLNTNALQKDADALQNQLNTSGKALLDLVAKGKANGVETNQVYIDLAKTMGKSPEEVKKMVDLQLESVKTAEKQKSSVDDLAKSWDDAKKATGETINKQTAVISQLNKELKNGKNLTKEQREEKQKLLKTAIDIGKEAVKENANIEAGIKQTEKILGLNKEKGKTKMELLKDEFDKQKALLDLELLEFENTQNNNILIEKRTRNSNDDLALNTKKFSLALKEVEAYEKILETKGLISKIRNDDGSVEFIGKIKPEDKTEIKRKLAELSKTIIDTNQGGVTIQTKLTTDKTEVDKLVKEIEEQNYNAKVEIGLITPEDKFTHLQTKLKEDATKLSNEIAEIQTKIQNAKTDSEKVVLLNQLKTKNGEVIAKEKELRESVKTEYDRQITDLKDSETKKLEAIQSSYDKQTEALNRFLDVYNEAYLSANDKQSSDKLDSIDKNLEKEKKKLDKYKNIGTISEEEYNNRIEEITQKGVDQKAKIEEKARKNALLLDNLKNGQNIAVQSAFEANKAKIELDSAKSQIEVARNLAPDKKQAFDDMLKLQSEYNSANEDYLKDSLNTEKKAKADDLKAKKEALTKTAGLSAEQLKAIESQTGILDLSQKILSEKSSTMFQIVGELQGGVQDGIANLFAGNTDGIVDSARKMFQTIGGILQAKITTMILDLVLSPGTVKYLAALPFPLNFLSVPIVTATITGGVKAVTDPLISSITSFASGGRIDKPTLAMVGDGAKLGSQNREWIFNDPQLIATVQMAVNSQNRGMEQRLMNIENLLASQEISTKLRGSDIEIAVRRTRIDKQRVSR